MTLVHILRAPQTETYDEQAILDSLDKYQLRYLKRWACGLCEKPLSQSGCGVSISTWEDPKTGEIHSMVCPQRVRVERLEGCLNGYKPRPNRRKTEPADD